ncbi:MAG: hypothetical protein KAQ94_06120 [Arcobacteraceae bacterium]|nr:hypothetical protein [Arcobacteraceae bacterium]
MTEQIMQGLTIAIFQILLVFFKHLNIRIIVKEKISISMFLTFMIQLSWLVSSSLGISAFLDSDYILVTVYLLSGVIGTYLNFKVKV